MNKPITKQNLQTALSMELTAMHQYQLHACVLDDWGMDLLAAKMREEMMEEMGHSEAFLVRLLFLKGEPRVEHAKLPKRATSLKEMFELDLADETEAIEFYSKASVEAAQEGDIGGRLLFERIALDEEGHMSWLELQLDLLKRMGEPAYIAKHMPAPTTHSSAE
ncbi:Bacterioferritin [Rubripirellula lacrimiformis]|uniref:Bacterioferritin n=1 Tax=Rubripirellula lacrimiformis TaxID=1930273 RepID=A0A517NCC9_9BACT|nr:bacterioferritin [Rubripirellula lacrimiformis]QDT04795.1 Bacterioferritin [Rubripirellula lacrimiformis]